jgi:serine/tyrosine/threonine adenylyltransferase
MDFSNTLQSFAALGTAFHTRLDAQPMPSPAWVARSQALARELGLSEEWMNSGEALATLTGNAKAKGSEPLASVYSGHQFGVWAGQLGDGRALLLGELTAPDGHPWEIQLKGAGLTPYSRMGDGRAVLRSSIREFLCSEAMHGLGIPTTRALAVTGSPQPVRREEMETAAVVTRCAPSFIRFGHFEHFSYSGQHAELKALADYVIGRFYAECQGAANPYAALLQAVSERTAKMIAQWQAVGFCHGVMNTDNMSILGLTIDYGPFQFLDAFDPNHICNHSDERGRYAYNKQPNIAYWNLFCLGQALMPLIREVEPDDDAAQAAALGALEPYKSIFPRELQSRMAAKLGFEQLHEGQREIIENILKLLAADRVDYTIFWRRLSHATSAREYTPVRDLFLDRAAFDAWLLSLQEHSNQSGCAQSADLMLKTNPIYVLRNHLGEVAIRAAKLGDFSEVQSLLSLLEHPYTEQSGKDSYAGFPPDWAASIEISCSS